MTNDHITFQLPVGYTDEAGTLHREGELKTLSGKEEELLSLMKGDGVRVITSLLTCCVLRLGTIQPFTMEMAQNLSPADRRCLLLKLWETTFGSRIRATISCPRPGCGEKVDIDFSTRDVPIDSKAETRLDLEMEVRCPGCGDEFTMPFDLHSSFFNKLRTGLQLLYREVHCLAYHYHWSEREIMEMPRWKRHKFLEILADEIERINNAGESRHFTSYHSSMNQDRLFIEDFHGPGIKLSPGDADDPAAWDLPYTRLEENRETSLENIGEHAVNIPIPGVEQLQESSAIKEKAAESRKPDAVEQKIISIQLPGKTGAGSSETPQLYNKIEQRTAATETFGAIETRQMQTIEIRDKGEYEIRPYMHPGNVGKTEAGPCETRQVYKNIQQIVPETGTAGEITPQAFENSPKDASSSSLPLFFAFRLPLSSSGVKNNLHSHLNRDKGSPGTAAIEQPVNMPGIQVEQFKKSSSIEEKAAKANEPGVVVPIISESQMPGKTKERVPETGTGSGYLLLDRQDKISDPGNREKPVIREKTAAAARIRRIRQETSRLKQSNPDPESSVSPPPPPEKQQINREEQTPVPKPPVQAPVSTKPVTGNGRRDQVPCAFWERHSLTRFHLNILR